MAITVDLPVWRAPSWDRTVEGSDPSPGLRDAALYWGGIAATGDATGGVVTFTHILPKDRDFMWLVRRLFLLGGASAATTLNAPGSYPQTPGSSATFSQTATITLDTSGRADVQELRAITALFSPLFWVPGDGAFGQPGLQWLIGNADGTAFRMYALYLRMPLRRITEAGIAALQA